MNDFDKALALANACLQQGRISENMHPHYLKSARTNYASTLAQLATLPVKAAATDSTAWGFDKLRRDDPQRLERMQREEPAKFTALRDLHVAELQGRSTKKTGRP